MFSRVSEPLAEYVKYYNDSDGNRKSCSGVDQDNFMHFLRPVDVGSGDLPWTGLLTGMFIRYIDGCDIIHELIMTLPQLHLVLVCRSSDCPENSISQEHQPRQGWMYSCFSAEILASLLTGLPRNGS